MSKLTEKVRAKVELDEGLWADKKKAWMATFENNVVSKDGSHQGKIDWNTAQYLHKQAHTPASAAEAYLKAKGPKAKGVTYESFSDTVKKVGKNLAARPNKGAMPGAKRVKKMTEEEELEEGRVKELAMDLDGPDSIPHHEFQKKYGKTKDEFRKLMNPPKAKSTPNQVLSKMYSDKIKEGKDADKDEREYGEPMGVPSGPGKSPYETYQGKKMSPKMQKKLALAASLGHVVNGVKKEEAEIDYPTLDEEVAEGSMLNKVRAMMGKIKEESDLEEGLVKNVVHNVVDKLDTMYQNHVAADVDMVGKRVTLDHGGEKGGAGTVTKSVKGTHSVRWDKGNAPKSKSGVSYSWQSQHYTSHLKPIKEETDLQEGPSLADMHPDNINSIIKQHGKQHKIYTGPGEPTKHGLGFKDLKAKLGVGTSGAVHKKFTAHLEKNGFKTSWSHTSNEWVAHPK